MLTKEQQVSNLEKLKELKSERLRKLQFKATKQGQIRAFTRSIFLFEEEIKKEEQDLQIIEEDLRDLNREISHLG
jgi:hypothetical protein